MLIESTCFLKKFGSLINSLREKENNENYNVKKVYTNKTEIKTCITP